MSRDAYQPTGYKLDGEDLETILGPLEANVLKEVYILAKPVKVREVFEAMKKTRKIAYTTVMSTMNTLHDKGILDREVIEGRGGLLYVYWPKKTRAEIEHSAVKTIMDSLIKNFGEAVTSYMVDMQNKEPNKKMKEV
jgi:predicted transcriptional regulator